MQTGTPRRRRKRVASRPTVQWNIRVPQVIRESVEQRALEEQRLAIEQGAQVMHVNPADMVIAAWRFYLQHHPQATGQIAEWLAKWQNVPLGEGESNTAEQ